MKNSIRKTPRKLFMDRDVHRIAVCSHKDRDTPYYMGIML